MKEMHDDKNIPLRPSRRSTNMASRGGHTHQRFSGLCYVSRPHRPSAPTKHHYSVITDQCVRVFYGAGTLTRASY
ncbi:hypothetical protein E2C01_038442 [Portunus trituberculatus]|uniref:Uncharacterized protein n=1 Tax=Portunus trituberculatus TaxID=210409 RepID=A0A5B7FE65_PORTR|nr:hypothetical protein [Portunus trituberculatus]